MARYDDRLSHLRDETGTILVDRILLDRGGYDSAGGYWGAGEPLWLAAADGEWIAFRAKDKKTAKQLVREAAPKAKVR